MAGLRPAFPSHRPGGVGGLVKGCGSGEEVYGPRAWSTYCESGSSRPGTPVPIWRTLLTFGASLTTRTELSKPKPIPEPARLPVGFSVFPATQ